MDAYRPHIGIGAWTASESKLSRRLKDEVERHSRPSWESEHTDHASLYNGRARSPERPRSAAGTYATAASGYDELRHPPSRRTDTRISTPLGFDDNSNVSIGGTGTAALYERRIASPHRPHSRSPRAEAGELAGDYASAGLGLSAYPRYTASGDLRATSRSGSSGRGLAGVHEDVREIRRQLGVGVDASVEELREEVRLLKQGLVQREALRGLEDKMSLLRQENEELKVKVACQAQELNTIKRSKEDVLLDIISEKQQRIADNEELMLLRDREDQAVQEITKLQDKVAELQRQVRELTSHSRNNNTTREYTNHTAAAAAASAAPYTNTSLPAAPVPHATPEQLRASQALTTLQRDMAAQLEILQTHLR